MKRILPIVTCLACLCLSARSLAETAYIVDQIQVGMHAESRLDSPIVKLVTTGTALTVRQRGVDMSEVVAEDGTVGWVNTAYLVDQHPVNGGDDDTEKVRLQTALQQAQTEVRRLEAAAELAASEESRQIATLREQLDELNAQLLAERRQAPVADAAGQMPELAARNAELEQTVYNLKQQMNSSNTPPGNGFGGTLNLDNWRLAALMALVLVLGLGLGMFVYDLLKRRQHGGFRV